MDVRVSHKGFCRSFFLIIAILFSFWSLQANAQTVNATAIDSITIKIELSGVFEWSLDERVDSQWREIKSGTNSSPWTFNLSRPGEGRVYSYRLRNKTPFSSEALYFSQSVTLEGNSPPSPPSPSARIGSNSIIIGWYEPPGTYSKLWRNGAPISPVNQPYTDTASLTPGVNYTYTVKSCKSSNNICSDDGPVTIKYPSLPVVSSFSTAINGAIARVTWEVSGEATSLILRRDSTTPIIVGPSPYIDSDITVGTTDKTYTYYLKACNVASVCSTEISSSLFVAAIPNPPSLSGTFNGASINVSWNTPAGATSFKFQRNNDGEKNVGNATSYYDTNLVRNTNYEYTVKACNVNGLCSAAASKSISVPNEPLFEVSSPAANSLKLVVSNVTNWYLQESKDGGYSWKDMEDIGGTFTRSGGSYRFRIYDCNQGGCSTSPTKYLTIAGSPPPPAPVFNTPVIGSSSIGLSWSSAGAHSYNITRAGARITPTAVGVPYTTASYTDTNVSAGSVYVYTANACNAAGDCSADTTYTSGLPPVAPTFTTQSLGNASINLGWTAPSGAASYQLKRGGTLLASSGNAFTDNTSLVPNTAYTYTIAACNATGQCSPTPTSTTITYPAVPTVDSFTAAVEGANAKLTWRLLGSPTSVSLLRNSTVIPVAVNASPYNDTGILPGSSYTYYLKACNAASVCSTEVSRTISPEPIPAMPTVNAIFNGATISVSWGSPDAYSYVVQRNGTTITPTNPTAYLDTSLSSNASYRYTVKACNVNNQCSAEVEKSISTPNEPLFEVSSTEANKFVLLVGANVTNWYLEESRDGGRNWITMSDRAGTNTRPGGSYQFRITDCNPGTGCRPSSSRALFIAGSTPPPVPTFGNPVPGTSSLALSWVSPGAVSYNIMRDSMRVTPTAEGIPYTTASFTDTNVSPGGVYSYEVSACNATRDCSAFTTLRTGMPPVAPTFTNQSFGTASINLAWTAPSGAARYELRRDGNLLTSSGTSFNDTTSLVSGKAYKYTIAACNATGQCSPTPTSTTITYPAVPTINSFTAVVEGAKAKLSWDVSGGTSSVQLLRNATALTATPTGTPFIDTGIAAGSSYTYYLKACNAASVCSAEVPVPLSVAAIPAMPTVSATFNGASASVGWTSPAGATSFDIQRDTGAVSKVTYTSYRDTSLIAGSTHNYKVKACNVNNQCSVAGTASLSVPNSPMFELSTSGNNTVNVVVANVDSWNLEESKDGGANWSPIPRSLSFSRPGGYYWYRLYNCFQTTNGCSRSTSKQIFLVGTPPPAAPVITATPGASSVTLNWTAPATATNYKFFRNGLAIATTGNSYTDTNVMAGGVYTYEVSACNSTEECSKPDIQSTVTSGLPPVAPVLSATPSISSVALSWTSPAGTTFYKVTRNGDLITPASPAYTGTSLTDSSLVPATYTYVVSACNSISQCTTSASVNMNVVGATPPNTPVLSGRLLANGDVELTWPTPAGGTVGGYKLRYVTGGQTYSLNAATNTYVTRNYGTYELQACTPGIPSCSAYSAQVTVTNGAAKPTVAASFSASLINPGDAVTLTWSSTNATICTGVPGSAVSGSTSYNPKGDLSISITCTGSGGSASTTAIVSVRSQSLPVTIEAEDYATMLGVWNEPTTDVGGGRDTGNIDTGDWMSYTNYNVIIPVTAAYKITYRVASPNSGTSLTLKDAVTDASLDTATLPNTTGWQKWTSVERTVNLRKGTRNVKIFGTVGGFNVNWFKIEAIPPTGTPVLTSATLVSPVDSASVASVTPNPCFQWNTDTFATQYSVYVSNTNDFDAQRWVKTVPAGTTSVCWNGGTGWTTEGLFKAELPAGIVAATPHYWQVVSTTSGGPGYSETRSFTLANAASGSEFTFDTQAPTNFKYSTSTSGTPDLGTSQFVATTQGDMNVSNGAAQYSIKIDLPPAVRNLKPSLALSYNSRSGNGLMGVGWSLSGMSAITRCRSTFASEGNSGGNDRLCLDGQKLVVANGATDYWATNTIYKTEIDNFSKVQAFGGTGLFAGHLYFKVWTKDGRILTYGGEESAQNSRIQKGSNAVDTWALDKVEDLYGNSYTITYQRNATDNEYYPDRINFGPDSAVVFKYQARAGQTPWGYEQGAKFKRTKILDTVTTYINVVSPSVPEAGTPVKRYDINYKLSDGTQRELVDTISECGYQSGAWKCAKPLTFTWQAGEFGFDEANSRQLTYCAGGNLSNVVQFIDMDGDGYNDAFQRNGAIAWGTSNSCFTNGDWVVNGYPTDSAQAIMTKSGYALLIKQTDTSVVPNIRKVGLLFNINKSLQTKSYLEIARDTIQTGGVVASDLSGDGLDDFIYNGKIFTQRDSTIPSFIARERGIWDADKYKVGSMVLDMQGNGTKTEIGTYVNYGPATPDSLVPVGVYVSNGDFLNGWSFEANQTQLFTVGQSYYSQPIKVSGGLYRVMADINGDGNKDFIYNHVNKETGSANYDKGEWLYRLNPQTGSVGPEVNTHIVATGGSVHPTNHYSYAYDYDKDGREDLLAVIPRSTDNCQLRVLLARDQNGEMKFEEAPGVVLRFLSGSACAPLYGDFQSNVFKGDANNDGIQDAFYGETVFYGKQKQPDLLVKVTDGFEADIAVDYSPLTGETNNGQPLYTPDATPPTFPQVPAGRGMQVVKKLSFSNGQGGYNERFYNYSGAKMDLQGRGFLGFAVVQVSDKASDTITSTDYRQSFPYTGRMDTVTTKTTAGDLISSSKNVYAIHSGNSRFPYVDYTLKKTYQLITRDLNSPVSATKIQNSYDVCGNLTEQVVETGSGVNASLISGVLNRVRTVNELDYFSTPACNDDFVFRTTKEASKTSTTDDARTTVTEYEANAVREVGKIIAFKGTALQKTTVITRAANGVVTGSTETSADIDGGTTAARTTSSTDLAKSLFPQTITTVLSSGNHVSTVAYDYRFGVESAITTPDLQTTTQSYDVLGRLVDSKSADGTRSEIVSFYCSNAPVSCPAGAYYGVGTKVTHTSVANALGAPLTIVYYDKLQREIRRSIYSLDGKAINTDTQYRADGKVSAVSEPFVTTSGSGAASFWTTYTNYDALGRARTVTGPDGGSRTTAYEKVGVTVKATDTVSIIGPRASSTQTTQRLVNALGQVVKVVDANTTPVDYTYNSTGNLAMTVVNNNLATLVSIEYDGQGNKSHITDPDAGVIDFNYNGFGELRRQIWQKDLAPATKSMVFTYDQLGRQLTRVDQPTSGSSTTYTWLWDTKQKGRLTSQSGNGHTVTYGYDGFSRVSTATTAIIGLGDRTFTYGYDNFSRPTTVTYPNGLKISRQYHAAGMAVQTTDISDTSNPKILWALGNDLDARGNFSNQLWGNGVVTQTGFDGKNGQIKTIKTGKLTSTSLSNLPGDIQALGYEYDTLGNLQTRTSQRTNAAGTALENLREEFVYDKLNRLKTSTTSGLFVRTNDYTYDELGNLKTRVSKMGSSTINDDIGTLTYGSNNASVHAVTSAGGKTYQYDKYGNMIKRGNETIDYNVFNKPIRISGNGVTTTMDYDADHERFREVNGSKVTYTFAGGLYEEIVEGTKTTQNSTVDGVILNTKILTNNVLASNDTQYLHTDNLGSVEAISNKLGNFVSRMSFSDWGKRQQSDWKTGSPTDIFPTNNGYTGHDHMDQHSLVHMGGRVYDPGLGRFLSADLFVQSPYSSQSFNRYSYVFNNPLSNVDPTGYECDKITSNAGTVWETVRYTTDTCSSTGGVDLGGTNEYKDFSQKETPMTTNLSQREWWAVPLTTTSFGSTIDPDMDVTKWKGDVLADATVPLYGLGKCILGAESCSKLEWGLSILPLPGAFGTGKMLLKEGGILAKGTASTSKALVPYHPPNNGAINQSAPFTLLPGSRVDRYGADAGRYLSPLDTPLPMRALSPSDFPRAYSMFEVKLPFTVQASNIAPAYGQTGLGMQFFTDRSISDLLGGGYLARVTP